MLHQPSRPSKSALPNICRLTLFLLALLLPMSAVADDFKVSNAWVTVPTDYDNPSAYFVIQNQDSKVRKIVGGSCTGCDWIEIRKVVFEDGAMTSEKLAEMAIPAGGAVAFVPRGLFLSLIGLSAIDSGSTFPIELEFSNGDKLTIEASVREP